MHIRTLTYLHSGNVHMAQKKYRCSENGLKENVTHFQISYLVHYSRDTIIARNRSHITTLIKKMYIITACATQVCNIVHKGQAKIQAFGLYCLISMINGSHVGCTLICNTTSHLPQWLACFNVSALEQCNNDVMHKLINWGLGQVNRELIITGCSE